MNIYISNLSYAVNDGDLKDLFGEYGEISSAKVSYYFKYNELLSVKNP